MDRVLSRSDAAFRVLTEGLAVWLPKSVLEELNVRALDEAWANRSPLICVQIPKWLADRIGLKGV